MKPYKKSAFIFRRDLRLHDNLGLIRALRLSEKVIPCFILDPDQIEDHPYRSLPALGFMIESLKDLDNQLKKYGSALSILQGRPYEAINKLIETHGVGCIFANRDYTPFSIERDRKIEDICLSKNTRFESCHDLLLNEPEKCKKNNGKPYTIFTPYFRNALKIMIPKPEKLDTPDFLRKNIGIDTESIYDHIPDHISGHIKEKLVAMHFRPGRSNALKLLENIKNMENYKTERDFPFPEKTTGLSAHLKFGTCSAREVYQTIAETLEPGFSADDNALARQLYWRDFYTHTAFFSPRVFGHSFKPEFEEIEWENNEDNFRAWCEGKTGFPMVDAGMRQLNDTGYMHGRLRMICASFLVKDLHIDWKWGEKYFAGHLADYDPALNNGNWQWAASTGCDAQPCFRIFNPWIQQKKYDPECLYIKKWIPELQTFPAKAIHGLEKQCLSGYPAQITDHRKASGLAKNIFSFRI